MAAALIAVCLGSAATAQQNEAPDWSHVAAHNRATPPLGLELVDDLSRAQKVFETKDAHAGVGKALYGSQRRQGEEIGVDVLPGGTSSMIIADDTIFIAYYRPSGDVRIPGPKTTFRTVGNREGWNPNIWSIAADDCLVAIDATTGKKKWVACNEGKGVNRVSIKRNDWGSSPVYSDGLVFFVGTTGRVYAHDAKTGDLLWESKTPGNEWMEADKAEALKEQRWAQSVRGLHTSPRVADDVLVAPALVNDGLCGFDVETGERLWTLVDGQQRFMSRLATPRVWKHDGREYVLAHDSGGTMSLIDPKNGDVLWRRDGNGQTPGSIPLAGDIAMINISTNDAGDALWGAYRISLTGAKKMWSLPEGPKYTHQSKPDSGPRAGYAVRDGVAWFWTGHTKSSKEYRNADKREHLLLAVDIQTGEILSETIVQQKHVHPQIVEDKLLLWSDASHGNPWRVSYFTLDPKGPKPLNVDYTLPASTISGYLVVMDTPVVDGRLYIRTM
ncbi:MAG: PQQ-binding-like beta-propeller repeat protein, partial [Planctomycetota bacterium]